MSNVTSGVEENKDQGSHDNQYGSDFQSTKEEQVNQLVEILNYLFEPNNLSSNAYLVYRAQGATFHIPIKCIYDENSIKAVTNDKDVINEALEKADNVVVIKKSDIIEAVKPARDQLQKNIIVKNIDRENESEFKQLVYSFDAAKENILSCYYNNQLNVVTIICKDEHFANQLYNFLASQTFQGSSVDCVLNFENLYISALENIKKKGNKRPGDHQQNRNFMMNPMQYQQFAYQMPFYYNQMNQGYKGGYFPPQNPYYMGGPVFDNRQMGNVMNAQQASNGNPTHSGNRQNNYKDNNTYNKSYGGGDASKRGGYQKRGTRGARGGAIGGRYNKNTARDETHQKAKFVVNESDFPTLSNEKEGQQ